MTYQDKLREAVLKDARQTIEGKMWPNDDEDWHNKTLEEVISELK